MATDQVQQLTKTIKNPIAQRWFEMATAHGARHDSFAMIKQGTPQYERWMNYFHRLGWVPFTLRMIHMNQEQSWTAPCEWPEGLQ